MSHGRPLKKEKHCIEPHYKHTYIYFVNRIKQSIPKVRIPNSHRFFFTKKQRIEKPNQVSELVVESGEQDNNDAKYAIQFESTKFYLLIQNAHLKI